MPDVPLLLNDKANTDEQARLLVSRLPAGGLFDLFCAQADHESRYLLGREHDESPAPPWELGQPRQVR